LADSVPARLTGGEEDLRDQADKAESLETMRPRDRVSDRTSRAFRFRAWSCDSWCLSRFTSARNSCSRVGIESPAMKLTRDPSSDWIQEPTIFVFLCMLNPIRWQRELSQFVFLCMNVTNSPPLGVSM